MLFNGVANKKNRKIFIIQTEPGSGVLKNIYSAHMLLYHVKNDENVSTFTRVFNLTYLNIFGTSCVLTRRCASQMVFALAYSASMIALFRLFIALKNKQYTLKKFSFSVK